MQVYTLPKSVTYRRLNRKFPHQPISFCPHLCSQTRGHTGCHFHFLSFGVNENLVSDEEIFYLKGIAGRWREEFSDQHIALLKRDGTITSSLEAMKKMQRGIDER